MGDQENLENKTTDDHGNGLQSLGATFPPEVFKFHYFFQSNTKVLEFKIRSFNLVQLNTNTLALQRDGIAFNHVLEDTMVDLTKKGKLGDSLADKV
jgi:hypothetical protein